METKMVMKSDLGDPNVGDWSFLSSRIDSMEIGGLDLAVEIDLFDGNDIAGLRFDAFDEESYDTVYQTAMKMREHLTTLLDEMTECYMSYKITKFGEENEKSQSFYAERNQTGEEDGEVPV